MTSTADPVWLFDLDGTLLEVNSFPLWVSQMLIGELPHLTLAARLSLSLRCAAAIAGRKVLRQSHVRFKRKLQRLWARTVMHAPAEPIRRRVYARPSWSGSSVTCARASSHCSARWRRAESTRS